MVSVPEASLLGLLVATVVVLGWPPLPGVSRELADSEGPMKGIAPWQTADSLSEPPWELLLWQ